jgi:O-methyltransferase
VKPTNPLVRIRRRIDREIMRNRLRKTYLKYQRHTMIPEGTYIDNLELAAAVKGVGGCIIECGVWGGGMIAGIAEVLGPEREYFLFDSFQGLPPAQDIDGPAFKQWQANPEGPTYHDNCSTPRGEAEEAMRMSGASQYSLIEGWFEDTIPSFTVPDEIALLRLDADLYSSTRICLGHFVPHLAKGGIVVIDDYLTWEGCTRAVHEFLAAQPATAEREPLRLRQFLNDVHYLR